MVSYNQVVYYPIKCRGRRLSGKVGKGEMASVARCGETVLKRLSSLIADITDEAILEKLESLYQYIENNQANLVNYQER